MVIEVLKDMKLKNNEYLTQMGTEVFQGGNTGEIERIFPGWSNEIIDTDISPIHPIP